MAQMQERAPAEPRAPSASRYLGRYGADGTHSAIDAQAGRELIEAVRSTLRGRRPDDQARILGWLCGRSLLGVARLNGFATAAETAYRHADILAGAVR